MSEPFGTTLGSVEKSKTKQYLVFAALLAAAAVFAGVVVFLSGSEPGSDGRKMSDGSNGSANDAELKEIAPGVKCRDLKEGTGEPCSPGMEVQLHFTGWVDGGEVFDTSREGKTAGQPATFDLNKMIKGWQDGVPGMKRGGVRKLVISPEKGYGPEGRKKIPPDSTLVFELEMLDFRPVKNVESGPGMPMPFDKSNGGTDDPGLREIVAGLKYRDLKVGTGEPVKPDADVTVHYTGWTVDGTVFDTSRENGRPFDVTLKKRQQSATYPAVIKGWQLGVPGMKRGGVRKLVISEALAYGNKPPLPQIPAGATLIFEVEFLY
jgi:peptidylprolyl isomerase